MPAPKKGSVSTALQPMRLPPLPKLRVRRPNQADANPCLTLMSSVLSECFSYSIYYALVCGHWGRGLGMDVVKKERGKEEGLAVGEANEVEGLRGLWV